MKNQNNKNNNTVSLHFEPQSMKEIMAMAKRLGTTPEKMMLQALGLFRAVQGRTIVLREKRKIDLEIKQFADNPAVIRYK